MIKRAYLFSFEYTKNNQNFYHQFVLTRTSWLPDFLSVWDSALEHTKQFTGTESSKCVLCVKG